MRSYTPAFSSYVCCCRIIYRISDKNMARLPGGDPFQRLRRCLSEHRQVRVLHKQQSIGERENPETQPRFSERFCHIRRQPNHHTTQKGRSGYLPSCHFSYLFLYSLLYSLFTASAHLHQGHSQLHPPHLLQHHLHHHPDLSLHFPDPRLLYHHYRHYYCY